MDLKIILHAHDANESSLILKHSSFHTIYSLKADLSFWILSTRHWFSWRMSPLWQPRFALQLKPWCFCYEPHNRVSVWHGSARGLFEKKEWINCNSFWQHLSSKHFKYEKQFLAEVGNCDHKHPCQFYCNSTMHTSLLANGMEVLRHSFCGRSLHWWWSCKTNAGLSTGCCLYFVSSICARHCWSIYIWRWQHCDSWRAGPWYFVET